MFLLHFYSSAFLVLAFAGSDNPLPFKHTNALRTIDLTKAYIRETHALVVENIATAPQSLYLWPIDKNLEENLSSISAKEEGTDSHNCTIKKIEGSGNQFFQISLPRTLGVGEKITLSISTIYVDVLEPVPAQISQDAKQYLRWTGSKYISSFYQTEKQKTKFKFPTQDVASFTKPSTDNEGPVLSGTTLTYGPYESISPSSYEEISVRYEYTAPITKIFSLNRQIDVSHWRNSLEFTEKYSLTNSAAQLKGFFSRLTQMKQQQTRTPVAALQILPISLTASARNAWFTDENGNVSTSQFTNTGKETVLALQPRYPIFGGWKYAFGIGWTVNLDKFVNLVSENRMFLNIPFIEGPLNVIYDSVVVNIRLPEGCEQVDSDVSLGSLVIEPYKSFLDTIGSTSIKLKAEKITDEMRGQRITVSYEFPPWAGIRKVIVGGGVIMTGILGLLLVKMIPTRIGE